MIAAIEQLLVHDRAGDPMTGLQWTRRTTEKIASQLGCLGIHISANTVARILKQLGFSLRVNQKKLSGRSDPDRDEQFRYIGELRERFTSNAHPVVSVDTKKKELIGNFKNPGRTWSREPVLVNDHDFPSDGLGLAVPYGIYDTIANRGTLYVGSSCDTAEFAVDNLERWWCEEGSLRYPEATDLLILADGGGSNGYRSRAFKCWLQERICDRHYLVVTVAHYPKSASKWNPIEHRLFSEITKNWAGQPLDSWDTLLHYAATTKTQTGLEVAAQRIDRQYQKGIRISDAQLATLDIEPHATQPNRNYTLYPRV